MAGVHYLAQFLYRQIPGIQGAIVRFRNSEILNY